MGTALSIVGGIVAVLLLILGCMAFSSYTKTSGGEVAVVRNGGPLDNNKVRQVIQPGSSRTYRGLFSHVHNYPAQQRFYTIAAANNSEYKDTADVMQTPTSDGVEVGIEGTLYFTLNTTDPKVMEEFDNKFGTRKFTSANGKAYYAWEADKGWNAFLGQIIRPVINNDLREQINNFTCADLVSSCALVQNGAIGKPVDPTAVSGKNNNGNIAAVQNAINSSLKDDIQRTLGGNYITGLQFNLTRITLPTNIQEAINNAQAAYADVSKAQAKVAQATAEAQANEQRQKGYENCPACALIDQLKAIPPTLQTFAPGAGFAITPSTKK